jgi:hypothetical protein
MGCKWLLLAAKQNDEDAKREMDRLARDLTPAADGGSTKTGERF